MSSVARNVPKQCLDAHLRTLRETWHPTTAAREFGAAQALHLFRHPDDRTVVGAVTWQSGGSNLLIGRDDRRHELFVGTTFTQRENAAFVRPNVSGEFDRVPQDGIRVHLFPVVDDFAESAARAPALASWPPHTQNLLHGVSIELGGAVLGAPSAFQQLDPLYARHLLTTSLLYTLRAPNSPLDADDLPWITGVQAALDAELQPTPPEPQAHADVWERISQNANDDDRTLAGVYAIMRDHTARAYLAQGDFESAFDLATGDVQQCYLALSDHYGLASLGQIVLAAGRKSTQLTT